MGEEESVYGCSYSGGGSGGDGGSLRSKKIKPKKVPQRGLGVAQLEKIRMEEEQKTQDSLHIDATSFLGIQKFKPSNIHPFLNSPAPTSPNALFRHSQSAPELEIFQESSCSVSNRGKEKIGCSPRLLGGGAFDPKQGSLPSPATPPPPPPPPHHFRPPTSSMMQLNSSFGISPSSVLTSHLEPPSNQSSRRNAYAPHFIEEDKIIGMKRSYPFTLETPPPPSFYCGFRPSFVPSSSRPDVQPLCSSGYRPNAESRNNKCIRGGPLLDYVTNELRDDEKLNGEFLTLAPPTSPLSKFYHNHPSKSESSGSIKESFNRFPIKVLSNQSSNDMRNNNGEEGGDMIDLNLKL